MEPQEPFSHLTVPIAGDAGYGKSYAQPPTWRDRAIEWSNVHARRVSQQALRALLGAVGLVIERNAHQTDLPPISTETFHPHRILIIRTDFLGDVVLTLPAVHAIHQAYPEATIDMIVLPSTAGILAGQPGINRVIPCAPHDWLIKGLLPPQNRQIAEFVQQLRNEHYDLAISVCGDWGSIIAMLSGAKRRVGYADEAYAHFLTDPVRGGRYHERKHEIEYVLALAAAAGGIIPPVTDRLRRPNVVVLDHARMRIQSLLADHGVLAERPLILLHPGSGNGRAKRWPLPYWARLADVIHLTQPATAIALIGGPGDQELAQQILANVLHRGIVINLIGATSLPEIAALLQRANLLVTGDSGPLHIAEAVDTRVIAIHGPTDPLLSGPSNQNSIILWREIWCAPCYDPAATAECRFKNPVCMKGIMPADVMPAINRQMDT